MMHIKEVKREHQILNIKKYNSENSIISIPFSRKLSRCTQMEVPLSVMLAIQILEAIKLSGFKFY